MATLAPETPRAPTAARDDRFFLISSFLMALTVISGFSLQFAMGRSTLAAPLLVHAHGLVFMGWVGIYVAQNWFAATGSMALHRRLGWFATGWIALMVVLGISITVVMVRGGRAPFFFTPGYFLVMNPMAVLVFAGLTAAAIVNRRRTAWHRRLHFCGMAVLLGPAFGRLLPMPFLPPYAGLAVFAALMLFPLTGVIADLRRSGRVHPAWAWGIGTLVAMQIVIETVPHTALGQAYYDVVVAGSPGAAIAPLDYPPPPTGPLITGR